MTAAAAIKPASFELVDRGDSVEVIARNIKAARTAILPVRSRLEVPIVGAPSVKRVVPTDPTVKVIELDGNDAPRALSVKLGFERADVKALSRFAQAIQVGDDLHLLIPRKIPVEGIAPRLPDPTLTPELAAAVARGEPSVALIGPRPDPGAARKVESKPAAADASNHVGANGNAPPGVQPAPIGAASAASNAASSSAPSSAPTAVPSAALDASGTAADAKPQAAGTDARSGAAATTAKPSADGKPLKQALASDADDTWFKIAMYAALGLAAAGAGIWLMRRRRLNFTPPASIEIIAQRSLGAKARIVWLSAGPREMIVSVTAQQVRMLGQWRKPDAPASLPAAHTHSDERYAPRHEIFDERSVGVRPHAADAPRRATSEFSAVVDKPMSPAVSGILRLRGRTGQIPAVVPEDIASGDVVADELWAKEILAATGARR
jgi:flagellar biogenesis protein FliO